MEGWKKYLKEGTFSQKLLDTDDFEEIATKDFGMPAISKEESDIIRHGHLDIPALHAAAQQAGARQIDRDFLIAWVTGRLSRYGGPSQEKAQRIYGDDSAYAGGQLYSKYKDIPTKWDSQEQSQPPHQGTTDHPSDGLSPMSPSAAGTHEGGLEGTSSPASSQPQGAPPSRVTVDQVLPTLKRLVTKDFSTPEGSQAAKQILHTLISALEQE